MFSELVDCIIEESKRGEKVKSITRYVNQVIQQIHARNDFDRDQWEAQVTRGRSEGVLTWPRPRNIRKMKTAFADGDRKRPFTYVSPNRDMGRIDWEYYYYTDEHYVFCAEHLCSVDLMYYGKPPFFTYYPKGKRPAVWCQDKNNGMGAWEYLTPDGKAYVSSLSDPAREATARYLVTDWLLDEYGYAIEWGALNLLYTATEQEELRRSSYAAFGTALADIIRDNAVASTND